MFGFDKNNNKEKKQVIAYIHTHWDREWYREFEVFRLRLLRVFDNVLNMLQEGKIPSFYFDGQVSVQLRIHDISRPLHITTILNIKSLQRNNRNLVFHLPAHQGITPGQQHIPLRSVLE
mgnify:CR=1 FL=1